MALDEDSQKYLEEAKKGKPRKFAMLCKGVSIEGLKIYKKGNEEKYKKELKKEAKGQFYYGIITGKGQNLVFQLPKELCEKFPTKEITLKAFLSDEADMKFKPTYELVASLEGEKEDKTDKDKADKDKAAKDKAGGSAAKGKASPAKEGKASPPNEGKTTA